MGQSEDSGGPLLFEAATTPLGGDCLASGMTVTVSVSMTCLGGDVTTMSSSRLLAAPTGGFSSLNLGHRCRVHVCTRTSVQATL